jgi:hypothetical protein
MVSFALSKSDAEKEKNRKNKLIQKVALFSFSQII